MCPRAPDVEPVEAWFDFDEMTGRLAPAPEFDRQIRARVRLTIRVFGLNATERCTARKHFLRRLQNDLRCRDIEDLTDALNQGPYRFVARKFMASTRTRRLLGQLV